MQVRSAWLQPARWNAVSHWSVSVGHQKFEYLWRQSEFLVMPQSSLGSGYQQWRATMLDNAVTQKIMCILTTVWTLDLITVSFILCSELYQNNAKSLSNSTSKKFNSPWQLLIKQYWRWWLVYEALKQSTCSSTLWFMILYNSFTFTCIMYVTKNHSKYVPWYSEQTVYNTFLLVHHTVCCLWACGLFSSAHRWAAIKYSCRQILGTTAVLICVGATLSRNCFFGHFMQNRTKIKSHHCDKP